MFLKRYVLLINDISSSLQNLNLGFFNLKINTSSNSNNLEGVIALKDVNLDVYKDNNDIAKLAKILSNANTKLIVTSDNMSRNDIKLKKLNLGITSASGAVSIDKVSGFLNDNDKFNAEGKIERKTDGSVGIDLSFNSQTNTPEKIAKFFDVKIPVLSSLKYISNIKGNVKSSANNASFDLEGTLKDGSVIIKGSSNDKGKNYNASIDVETSSNVEDILSSLSIPARSLISKKGKLSLKGKISGNDNVYKITIIKGKIVDVAFASSIDKGKTTKAKITLNYLDIDNFIKSDLEKYLNKDTEIALTVNKNSWSDKFNAAIKYKDKNLASVKGSINNVDLNGLLKKSDIPNNLYMSKGDIEFDLVKTNKKVTGDVVVKTSNLEIPELNYNEVGMLLNAYDDVPKDLKKDILIELKKGKIMFGGIEVKAVIDGDNISLKEPIKHVASFGNIEISEAGINLQNKNYEVVVKFDILKPKRIPKFKIEYSKGKVNIVGLTELETFIEKNNPPPLQIFTDVLATPMPVEASDPTFVAEPVKPLESTPTPDEQAIGGILDRLDE